MRLQQLGWNSEFQKHFSILETGNNCIPARVTEESKGIYRVLSEQGEFLAAVAGRIRFQAESRIHFPAIGDWVAIAPRISESRATIEQILPRKTVLTRKGSGKGFEEQIIAANVDTIFIVTSLNQDFNVRRMERYLAIVWESGSQPVVILNKVDLCLDPDAFREIMENTSVPVHVLSALHGQGVTQLTQYLQEGKTAAFIGSSGVGKSTIINALAGCSMQRVQPVREWDDRGRHTTSSRQMIVLPEGGIVIDTPGMREIALWESDGGLMKTFQDLQEFVSQCRFRDCSHQGEPGCAVRTAIENGILSSERLDSYHKLQAELKFVESKTNGNVRRAAKARAKRGAKAMKRFYKE